MGISRVDDRGGRLSAGLLAIVTSLAACPCSSGAESPKSDAPTSVRILAQINGKDELRVSHRWAGWVNLAHGSPQTVEINGRRWNPQSQPLWLLERGLPLLREDIDLAGAVFTKLRGRGGVDFRHDAKGLVITFDDGPQGGADDYEVLIEFADVVCEESSRSLHAIEDMPDSVDVSVGGQIDGGNAVRISPDRAEWLHYDVWHPELVTINGRSWNPKAQPVLSPNGPFYPRGTNVANARLIERKGRGAVQLDRDGDQLTIRFDDRLPPGGDEYLARVRIPLEPLVRVEIRCDEPTYTAGEKLRVLRYREGETDPEIVSGQRIVDQRGRCIAALPPGEYQFEVQTLATPNVIVSLRSGRVHVNSKQANVRLRAIQIRTTDLKISGCPPLKLTDVGIRSILPTGDVSWRRTSPTERLGLIVSPNQTYRVRAMGSNGATHAAVWKELSASKLSRIAERTDRWTELSFDWHPGTLPRKKSGVVFHFPDTSAELPLADRTRLLTNRRFVELGYWYELVNNRKVSFRRRGYVLPAAPAKHSQALGGPIVGRASTIVILNENLGKAGAKQIWCDISAQDTAAHTLDPKKSSVGWNWSLKMRDGSPVPEFPLTEEGISRVGDPADTVLAVASLDLEQPIRYELLPQRFVPIESKHVRTNLPPYMTWRSKAYLAQAQRSLDGIGAVRDLPVDPNYKLRIAWWMNGGAIGGHGGITMPIHGMTADFGWFSHPWAISHEILHGFGYGHHDDMNRVDRLVQEYFRRFQWSVADRPEFVPPELASANQ